MTTILDEMAEAVGEADLIWVKDTTDNRPGLHVMAEAAARVVAKRLRERARLHRVAAHECGPDDVQVHAAAELLLSALADELDPPGGGT